MPQPKARAPSTSSAEWQIPGPSVPERIADWLISTGKGENWTAKALKYNPLMMLADPYNQLGKAWTGTERSGSEAMQIGTDVIKGVGRAAADPFLAVERGSQAIGRGEMPILDALTVGAAGAGPAAFRPAAEMTNTLGVFGGRLAKTADHAKLAKAEEMTKAGMDRGAIWDETGWFQEPSGKWQFEIDDSPSAMTYAMEGRSPDLLTHPELYVAYPSLADMPAARTREALDVRGGFDGKRISVADRLPLNDARSTMLHELQHGIQRIEGLPKGGSLASGLLAKPPTVEALETQLISLRQRSKELLDRNSKMLDVHGRKLLRSKSLRDEFDRNRAEVDEVQSKTSALSKALLEAEASHLKTLTPDGLFDYYERLAGEVQSRAVQGRMNMTPDQRRARPPWLDYDVPEAQQIIAPPSPSSNWLQRLTSALAGTKD